MKKDSSAKAQSWYCFECFLRCGVETPIAAGDCIIVHLSDGGAPLVGHLREGKPCGPVFPDPESPVDS